MFRRLLSRFESRYDGRSRLFRLRARAMLATYTVGFLAACVVLVNDLFFGQHSALFHVVVDGALILPLGAGAVLVWIGRDDVAVLAVPAALVSFSLGTLGAALDGRVDRFYSGWARWYPVFIAANVLFLSWRGGLAATIIAAVWSIGMYFVFGLDLIGTPREIIPTDVVDTVSIVLLTGVITVSAIGFIEGELKRNRALTAALESKVAERTGQLESALGERQTVLDHMADGLVAVGGDGRLQLLNEQVQRMFDVPGARDSWSESTLPEPVWEIVQRARRSGQAEEEVIELPGPRFVRVSANPLPGGEGGVVALVRDVTLEREVDRLKTDFIATVSHELRTPLTSVLGFSKMTLGRLENRVAPSVPEDDTRAQKALGQMRRNLGIVVSEGERLTALINDVLDIAKMEAGRVEWRREPVDIGAVVRQAADAVSALFPEDGVVALHVEIEPDLPELIGDAHRLVQVVVNLLSNASKFTREGRVTVGARVVSDGIEVAVTDTGAGIAPSQQAAVFERFRQVEDTLTDKPQGTGLGLPICQQIVRAHGAEIQLESTVGEGSRFWFVLAPDEASA